MARKKNPSVALMLLTVTGVAVGGYAVWTLLRPAPKKKRKKKVAFDEPKGKKRPAPKKGSQEPFVGTGWQDWPRRDVFPDEVAIADALFVLGYNVDPSEPGWSPADLLSESTRNQVDLFQAEWNALAKNRPMILADTYGLPEHPGLNRTGLLNPETVRVLARVYQRELQDPSRWRQVTIG